MGMQYRHGDVLIEQIGALPRGAEKLSHTVLAHGEVTGHCHRLSDPDRGDLFRGREGLFLHVREPVDLIHEEHHPITLAGGYYRVWRQREYSPEEIRIIRD